MRINKTTKQIVSKDFKTHQIDELYPMHEGSSHLLIGCRGADYAASRIVNAVEDCDATLLNLNVMLDPDNRYELLVDIRVNRVSGASIARSLERYGYDVIEFESDSEVDDELTRRRIEELLRYINI